MGLSSVGSSSANLQVVSTPRPTGASGRIIDVGDLPDGVSQRSQPSEGIIDVGDLPDGLAPSSTEKIIDVGDLPDGVAAGATVETYFKTGFDALA